MLRVLIAEDSPTARDLLVAILESDPDITIVGTATNGAEAIELTKQLRPAVVTMDVRMPIVDGLEATRRIMIEAPTPIVIVSGVVDERDVEVSMQALRDGALAVLGKPSGPDTSDFEAQRQRLVDTVKAMADVKVVRRWPTPSIARASTLVVTRQQRPRIIAVAASTGGPGALARVLGDLPPNFEPPILVVQHMAPGFVKGFTTWLNTVAALPVTIAAQGEALCANTVYVAPEGCHLQVTTQGTVLLSRTPPINGFRPSATALFESVARAFRETAVGVVLTGMGDDGVTGLRAIRNAGGRIVGQDEATSVVFGMPGAAAAAGLVDAMVPIGAIAPFLMDLM